MFSFIHAADLHLDSPLRGLEQYDGAPVEEIRGATRRALEHLVTLALEERVAFVLIAGDLYDGDWRDYNTGLFFVAQMRRLQEATIPVFIVAGNHDAASQLTKSLPVPENVRFFATRAPETKIIEAVDVAIHGQGYATRRVTSNLADAYPAAEPHCFNIGLLHTSVAGRSGHEPYAPCTLAALQAKGYDYWALGHIHAREVLCEDPWVVFSGNTQGRHVRESGSKGCSLVTVEAGQVRQVEHRPLDVLRWDLRTVDLAGAADEDDILARMRTTLRAAIAGVDRPVALRLHCAGACRAHGLLLDKPDYWVNQLRALATDIGNGRLWIEEVHLRTQPLPAALPSPETALGGLWHSLQAYTPTDEEVQALAGGFAELANKLPNEFRTSEDGLDPADPATVRAALEDAKALLQARLFTGGGAA